MVAFLSFRNVSWFIDIHVWHFRKNREIINNNDRKEKNHFKSDVYPISVFKRKVASLNKIYG